MPVWDLSGAREAALSYRRRHPPNPPLTQVRDGGPDHAEALAIDLSRSLHLWSWEIDIGCRKGRLDVARRLAKALRAQRRAARAGQWSYDIACHSRLIDLERRLRALDRTPTRRLSRTKEKQGLMQSPATMPVDRSANGQH